MLIHTALAGILTTRGIFPFGSLLRVLDGHLGEVQGTDGTCQGLARTEIDFRTLDEGGVVGQSAVAVLH